MKKNLIKTALMAGMFLTATSLFAETHWSIGVGINTPGYVTGGYYGGPAYYDGYYAPPAPPAYAAVRPPCPGPGYSWIDGYWYPDGGRYLWRAGYWAMPPYAGGYWVAPRYYGGRYYNGYWGGDRDHDGIPNRFDRYDNRYRGGWDRGYDRDRGHERYEHRGGYGYGFRR